MEDQDQNVNMNPPPQDNQMNSTNMINQLAEVSQNAASP